MPIVLKWKCFFGRQLRLSTGLLESRKSSSLAVTGVDLREAVRGTAGRLGSGCRGVQSLEDYHQVRAAARGTCVKRSQRRQLTLIARVFPI